ncbi:uncharacterized protein DUF3347 [Ulvibacter sp. MAR_2010_11]|uniref:DUF3347 domain-containing protein n=1 Tax=Ulvibacter sp. MAR_2010_11 TaxID=1250229 RepID=UPI000C2C0F4C|nr:DUF3347 domain-containing protein [Ulvibacter sp. MAR_2010_11]PKA82492.1 uncharacterized protein DUF3347 [Ulvibacter sp. MAR_2010_11]
MKYPFISLFAIVLFSLGACVDSKKESEPEIVEVKTQETPEVYTSEAMVAEFNDPKIAEVYVQYINVKTALVNTNAKDAALTASKLKEALLEVSENQKMLETTEKIMMSDDVEVQRTAFFELSAAVDSLISKGLKSGTIYKQYCPMAFGNTGAFWLSNSRDIMNPYFGDKMLKCGRIQKEIK